MTVLPLPTAATRLCITSFFAVCLHIGILCGIVSLLQIATKRANQYPLQITVVHTPSQPPDEKNFVAENSQSSGGKLRTNENSFPHLMLHHNPQPRSASRPSHGKTTQLQPGEDKTLLTTHPQSPAMINPQEQSTASAANNPKALALQQKIAKIDGLRARLAELQQTPSPSETVRPVAAAAHQAKDAAYLQQWQQHVEQVGNDHYPNEAKQKHLYGELILLVAINSDGTLQRVEVRLSSGHNVLDAAAVHIVRLAAPFAAPPEEIRQGADVIEIIRTWQFLPGNYLQTTS